MAASERVVPDLSEARQDPLAMKFRVGGVECIVIDDGPVEFVVKEVFAGVPESAVGYVLNHLDLMSGEDYDPRKETTMDFAEQTSQGDHTAAPRLVEVPNKVLVVKTLQHCVLVDCGPGVRLSGFNLGGRVMARMEQEGISPSEVTHVVLTHAHYDRIGGSMVDDGTPAFPNARFVVSKPEYTYWMHGGDDSNWAAPHNLMELEKATASQRMKQLEAIDVLDLVQFHCGPDGPPPSPREQPKQNPQAGQDAAAKKRRGSTSKRRGSKSDPPEPAPAVREEAPAVKAHTKFWGEEDVAEIVPGVEMIFTGGHTPGHCIIRIRDNEEVCYAMGDLVMHPAVLGHPEWSGGYHHDPEAAKREMDKWLHVAAEENAKVQMYHFPYPGVGVPHPKTSPDNRNTWVIVPTPPGRLGMEELANLVMAHHLQLGPALDFVDEIRDDVSMLHRATHRKPNITLQMHAELIQKIDKRFADACALTEECREALREGLRPDSVYDPKDFNKELSSKKMTELLLEYVWMVMDATYVTETELVDLEFPKHSFKDFESLVFTLDGIGELIVRFISAMKRSELPVPFTVFGDHRMILEVLGLELSEILFWRQGALRYMYTATLINMNRLDELDTEVLETGADRLEKMRTLRQLREPLSADNYVMGSGGAETYKLMEDGIYSDVHLLSMMYEAELWYWRWKEFEAREVKDTSKSVYREKASHLCANYIRIVTHSLADRGWNCDRAKQILAEAEQDDIKKDVSRIALH